MTVYALVATTSIAATLGLFAFAYWWQRPEEKRHFWFWIAMFFSCAFSLGRFAQMIGVSADRPWLPPSFIVAAALLGVWSTTEFASAYVELRLSRAERLFTAALAAVPVLLVFTTELILTKTPVVRTLHSGETFVGVKVGPLYPLFSLVTLSMWVLGCVRLARGNALATRGGKYFMVAFSAGIVVHVFDVVGLVFHLSTPRLSDYSTMPVAIVFALAEVNRYAGLFDALEEKVRERTRDLAQANQELTDEHAEREALQRRLAEAQRLEALGQLAGGVAHDFNNLLTVVAGSNHLIQLVAGHIPEVAEATAGIRSASERGAALVRQLLLFARKEAALPRAVDLAQQVRDLLPLLEPLAGKQVRVGVRADAPAEVVIDPTQFDQIVMNLVVNARAAMPEGGDVRIEVAAFRDSDTHGGQETVRVTVSDTGTGIPGDVLPRIFEPFFTTKAEHGTGLGLATVLRATREAGGTVTVNSEPGAGTTFTMTFPRVA